MDAIVAMGPYQHSTGLMHVTGPTLDVVFTSGQGEEELNLESSLSWLNHLLKIWTQHHFCGKEGLIIMVHSQRLMDPSDAQNILGSFQLVWFLLQSILWSLTGLQR